MGFLAALERPTFHAETRSRPDAWDDRWYESGLSSATGAIGPDLAETISAVWAAKTILTEGLASLPLITYKRDGEKRQRWPAHPLYSLLRYQPNQTQTAFEFWEMQVGHVAFSGNAYAHIVEGPRGFADQLVPIHPSRVTPARLPSGGVQYAVKGGAGVPAKTFSQDQIFHLKHRSRDGLVGDSVLDYASQSLGTALALQRFQSRFFSNGTTSSFAVINKSSEAPDKIKAMGEYIRTFTSGRQDGSFGVLPLGGNIEITPLGMNLDDAQLALLLESTVHDVARWFNIPVHLLRESKTPTFASIEMFDLELVMHTFRPWAIRIEQAIMRDLILAPDVYFSEFLLEALLRADSASRAAFYASAITNGWMSRNEVRMRENLNPEPGLETFLEPLNMGRANDRRQADGQRASAIVQEACSRLVRIELAAVGKLAQKHATDAQAWNEGLREFYAEHAEKVCQTLRLPLPIAREYAGRQGWRLQQCGLAVTKDWEHTVVGELVDIALRGGPELGEAALNHEIERMAA